VVEEVEAQLVAAADSLALVQGDPYTAWPLINSGRLQVQQQADKVARTHASLIPALGAFLYGDMLRGVESSLLLPDACAMRWLTEAGLTGCRQSGCTRLPLSLPTRADGLPRHRGGSSLGGRRAVSEREGSVPWGTGCVMVMPVVFLSWTWLSRGGVCGIRAAGLLSGSPTVRNGTTYDDKPLHSTTQTQDPTDLRAPCPGNTGCCELRRVMA
jgi:hypothetical protein